MGGTKRRSFESQRREAILQHRVRFHLTPNEKTTGYLLIPDGNGKRPAVVTVFYEPETAIGLGEANFAAKTYVR